MKKRRKIIIGAAVLVIVLLVVAGVEYGVSKSSNAGRDDSSASVDDSGTADDENASVSSSEETTDSANDATVDGSSSTSGEDGSDETGADDMPDGTEWRNHMSAAGNENSTDTTTPADNSNTQPTTVTFPYQIPDSDLMVTNISSYDGIFLEDGSDQEVSGIAAMILQNTGVINVEYTSISIKRDGEELQFEASDIPAGATVVVQEKNKAAYGSGTFSDCSAVVADLDSFEMSEDQVKVEETEEGALQVTNLTDSEIPCIRIFYKFYMEDQQSYVGGITYTAKLTNVAGGSSQTVTPSHYVAGSSQVLMVRTYDTAE